MTFRKVYDFGRRVCEDRSSSAPSYENGSCDSGLADRLFPGRVASWSAPPLSPQDVISLLNRLLMASSRNSVVLFSCVF